MPTHTAASSILSAWGWLPMGQFLLLQAVGNAGLSGSFTALPLQLLTQGNCSHLAYPPIAVGSFLREERWSSLQSLPTTLLQERGWGRTHRPKAATVAEGVRLSSLFTLSVLISGHPKWPTPKKSSPSESGVLLTSQSNTFLSVSMCTSLIKAPHITIDAAKPELGQGVGTAQVLRRSPWMAGQLLPVRAEPALFCRSRGQKHKETQIRELCMMVLLGILSALRLPWEHVGTWGTQETFLRCDKGHWWSVTAAAPEIAGAVLQSPGLYK